MHRHIDVASVCVSCTLYTARRRIPQRETGLARWSACLVDFGPRNECVSLTLPSPSIPLAHFHPTISLQLTRGQFPTLERNKFARALLPLFIFPTPSIVPPTLSTAPRAIRSFIHFSYKNTYFRCLLSHFRIAFDLSILKRNAMRTKIEAFFLFTGIARMTR